MIRRCWMVIDNQGREAVFLHSQRAHMMEYASQHHGVFIQMFGNCSLPPKGTDVVDIEARIIPGDVIDRDTRVGGP